jgi:hypothetical protein
MYEWLRWLMIEIVLFYFGTVVLSTIAIGLVCYGLYRVVHNQRVRRWLTQRADYNLQG